jgi:hypothetical protein
MATANKKATGEVTAPPLKNTTTMKKIFSVTHVTISASEPDANGFSDTRVFGTMEEAKKQLRIWKDEELECLREYNASYSVYTDTDTKFHCTWDYDNEGIKITIREHELK